MVAFPSRSKFRIPLGADNSLGSAGVLLDLCEGGTLCGFEVYPTGWIHEVALHWRGSYIYIYIKKKKYIYIYIYIYSSCINF
jgi:hypothetical protein